MEIFNKNQSGQTLIETLVAIFMLVMGITAALGLAIYALNSSGSITRQIIGAGLAREGVEAVKQMRDTNWLVQATPETNCYNFVDGMQTAECYKSWLGDQPLNDAAFCLNPSNGSLNACNGGLASRTYFLEVDSNQPDEGFWTLEPSVANFGLDFNGTPGTTGFYFSPNGGVTCANAGSEYCRKITLTLDFTAPYNHPSGPFYDASDIGPALRVQSQVWWVDKKCPRVIDFSLASNACRTELTAYLTNWKDYTNE